MFTKSTILFLSAVVLCAACAPDQLIFHNHNLRNLPNVAFRPGGSSSSDPDDKPDEPPVDTIVAPEPPSPDIFYLLTLEYPPGYNWIDDLQRGQVEDAYFVVYQDFNEVLRVPISDKGQVPSDADRAFLIYGDLYTAFTDNTSTVIRKNGEELFTISSRENITSLLVEGDDVYTLGSSPTKRDVSYRKNGQSIIYVSDASVIKDFHLDEGRICFSYVVHSPEQKYFLCVGETSFQISEGPADLVYDLQFSLGQPMYIYMEDIVVYEYLPKWGAIPFTYAPDESYCYDYKIFMAGGEEVPVEYYHYGNLWMDINIFGPRTVSISGVQYPQAATYACRDAVVVVYYKKGAGYYIQTVKKEAALEYAIPQRFNYAPRTRGVVEIDGEVYAGFSTKCVDGESIIQMGQNKYKGLRFNGYIVALGK